MSGSVARVAIARIAVAICAATSSIGCVLPPSEGYGAAHDEIVNGEVTSDYPAVGALTFRRTRCQQVPDVALCTVTLISDTLVLTAGHCVANRPERSLSVFFGAGLGEPGGRSFNVARHFLHPLYDPASSDYDVALLQLSQAPPIAPMPLSAAIVDNDWVGQPLVMVGFGETEAGAADGLKRHGSGVVAAVDERTVRIDAGPAVTCRGDSGGPALRFADGTPELVATTSAGDHQCTSHNVSVRADVLLDAFINPVLAELEPSPNPTLPLANLCLSECNNDNDCPGTLLCEGDGSGSRWCKHPQLAAGDFAEACEFDDQCGSGHCAPTNEGCACYSACATDEGDNATTKVAPEDAGCTVARVAPLAPHGRRRGWLWGALLASLCFAGHRRARG